MFMCLGNGTVVIFYFSASGYMATNSRSVNITDQGDRTGGNADDGSMSSLMNQLTPPSDSDDLDMVNYALRPGRSQLSAQLAAKDFVWTD